MARRIALFSLFLFLASPLFAAPQMTYEINGTPTGLGWAPSAFPLPYEIDDRITRLNPDAAAMIARAFAAWEKVEGTSVRFQSRGTIPQISASSPDRVVVTIADDLLANQGSAAITSYSYDIHTGRMLDADIALDPTLFDGKLNAPMAIQHEIGHILGLDHSPVLSSIMYPYVDSGNAPAEIDLDDRITIANIYPQADPTLLGATLTGRIMGDDGGIFAAQVVAVNAQGQPVATALTNAAGEFTISGVPSGRYKLYTEPLDGPVDPAALQGTFRQAKRTSFPTEFYASDIEVSDGNVYGNLVLTASGPAQLNPRWIGVSAVGRGDVSLSSSPVCVKPGETVTITVGGDGFTSGMTQFDVLNPAFRRVSEYSWSSNYVRADYTLDPAARSTSSVVLVRSGRETATLTGALRVHPEQQASGRRRAVRH